MDVANVEVDDDDEDDADVEEREEGFDNGCGTSTYWRNCLSLPPYTFAKNFLETNGIPLGSGLIENVGTS
jgi:hypothetical protein